MSNAFDIVHTINVVPQAGETDCWATAIAMALRTVSPARVASIAASRRVELEDDGSLADNRGNVERLARSVLMRAIPLARIPAIEVLARIMRDASVVVLGRVQYFRRRGLMSFRAGSPILHAVTIYGLYGNGTAAGTHVVMVDPWTARRQRHLYSELRRQIPDPKYLLYYHG